MISSGHFLPAVLQAATILILLCFYYQVVQIRKELPKDLPKETVSQDLESVESGPYTITQSSVVGEALKYRIEYLQKDNWAQHWEIASLKKKLEALQEQVDNLAGRIPPKEPAEFDPGDFLPARPAEPNEPAIQHLPQSEARYVR